MIQRLKLRNSKQTIVLGPKLGEGGTQGLPVVHGTNPGLLIKRYHDDQLPLDPQLVEKLEFLKLNLPLPSQAGHDFAVPLDIALDVVTSEPLGYVMQNVDDAVDIQEIGNAPWLPDAFRYRVLKNSAAALVDLHNVDMFRGDFLNSRVLRDGTVFEIDNDSLQVGNRFPCGFVKLQFAAPELLRELDNGTEVCDFPITAEFDRFAFAVQAYFILTGDHPFRCHYSGSSRRLGKIECMKQGIFPWTGRHDDYHPPKGGKFEELHPKLQALFFECFEVGHSDPMARPSIESWFNAFEALQNA